MIDVKVTDEVYLSVIQAQAIRIAELELKATALEAALVELNSGIPDDGQLLRVAGPEEPEPAALEAPVDDEDCGCKDKRKRRGA